MKIDPIMHGSNHCKECGLTASQRIAIGQENIDMCKNCTRDLLVLLANEAR